MRVFAYEHVTAGGLGNDVPSSLLREGRAMLNAMVADFQRVRAVEVVTIEDSHPAIFKQTAASCDWSLVIAPEFDNHLRDRSQAVLDAGGRLLGPSPTAIELTGDKFALSEFWRRRGVPQPATQLLNRNVSAPFPGRWIMKPRFGAGSQATFLIGNPADATRAWDQAALEGVGADFIAQPYLDGQAVSVAILIGPAERIALAPARQHLSNDGRFRYHGGSLPLPPPLAARARHLALQAVAGIEGLQGYVGVDLILGPDGVDHAIEINSRLTTSYLGLRRLCWENLAELMLLCVRGEPITQPLWRDEEVRFGIDAFERNP